MESYYARALQGDLPSSSISGTEDHLPRLFEVLDIICGDDGETYALQLKNVLRAAEGDGPLNKRPVLQEAVEEILTRIHAGESTNTYLTPHHTVLKGICYLADSAWRSACIGVLFSSITGKDSEVGPTLMVILTALFCEYLELSPTSPVELLCGVADRVTSYSRSCCPALASLYSLT